MALIESPEQYTIARLRSMEELRKLFEPDGEADELNWCFFGTSGVHGNYNALCDLFEPVEGATGGVPGVGRLTVLVVRPRTVVVYYGTIDVRPTDISFLRNLALTTLKGIYESQGRTWDFAEASEGLGDGGD